ncbi:hypothetical protein DTB58_01215 [Streptomyces griseus]|nr:hypothetical protein [Streptomyces griseus]
MRRNPTHRSPARDEGRPPETQARRHFEDTRPVAPAVRNIDRTVESLDLESSLIKTERGECRPPPGSGRGTAATGRHHRSRRDPGRPCRQ